MSPEQIGDAVRAALREVVPGAELSQLDEAADLRKQLDLDSVDILRFAAALHRTLGVDVPDADLRELRTLRSCVAYLAKRLAPASY